MGKTVDIAQTSQKIKDFARSVGADLVGIASAEPDEEGQKHLEDFIAENRQGSMHYLEDPVKRTRPKQLLPGAQSVVVIAVNYYRDVPPAPSGSGRFARYAYGRDYHKVIKKLLRQIENYIVQTYPDAVCKPCVDSSPIMEKSFAVRAGLGFIGKNTTLITREYGSYVLLGEILTTLKLAPDKPADGTCGTCTRCMEACPTDAITGPRRMDSRKCISYLTIENKGPIPEEFRGKMGNWVFGCDICQEVCPYNKAFAKPLHLKEFREVKIAGHSMPLEEILAMQTDEEFLERFAGSPVMRTKKAGLQRNARFILGKESKST